MVDECHQPLGGKTLGLRKGMDREAVDEREEGVGLHRRVEVSAKLPSLLAFLDQLVEAGARPRRPAGGNRTRAPGRRRREE